jgi:hypothetical protein
VWLPLHLLRMHWSDEAFVNDANLNRFARKNVAFTSKKVSFYTGLAFLEEDHLPKKQRIAMWETYEAYICQNNLRVTSTQVGLANLELGWTLPPDQTHQSSGGASRMHDARCSGTSNAGERGTRLESLDIEMHNDKCTKGVHIEHAHACSRTHRACTHRAACTRTHRACTHRAARTYASTQTYSCTPRYIICMHACMCVIVCAEKERKR